jgi:hypothetical protein
VPTTGGVGQQGAPEPLLVEVDQPAVLVDEVGRGGALDRPGGCTHRRPLDRRGIVSGRRRCEGPGQPVGYGGVAGRSREGRHQSAFATGREQQGDRRVAARRPARRRAGARDPDLGRGFGVFLGAYAGVVDGGSPPSASTVPGHVHPAPSASRQSRPGAGGMRQGRTSNPFGHVLRALPRHFGGPATKIRQFCIGRSVIAHMRYARGPVG